MNRNDIFHEIELERERQEILHPLPNMRSKNSEEEQVLKNYFLIQNMLAVLIEEIGEVGAAVQGDGDLKEELIQVAATAVRWLENMN